MRILKIRHEDVGKRNISEFLSSDSTLMAQAEKGETSARGTHRRRGDRQLPPNHRPAPIINQATDELNVAVLKIVSAEKSAAQARAKSNGMAVHTFADIITDSADFKRTIAMAKRFAVSAENIMLTGESGTGKELFAQAIHKCPKPSPGTVHGRQLRRHAAGTHRQRTFGYEGAASPARTAAAVRQNRNAHGGTLFLDEIATCRSTSRPYSSSGPRRQAGYEGRRATRYKKSTFRIIVATTKTSTKWSKDARFREDLYFRLSVLTISIPHSQGQKRRHRTAHQILHLSNLACATL
jgi:transcriptional regulator with PAS, ATPase and Fis domain